MISNARTAVEHFMLMVISEENIAAMPATSQIDLMAVVIMSKEEFKNEKLYQTTMYIARQMLAEGLISEEEYRQINTIFTEKYKPTLGTLFADIDLL